MAAPSEIYVDPSIAGNSGAGTSGDPYGDLQYALNTMTRDATNGDRINIKAGTSEVLAAALSLATYGTPTAAAPLVFQGYTSTAGDGGQGSVSGAASYSMIDGSTLDHLGFRDLRITNCAGAQAAIRARNNIWVVDCQIDTSALGVNLNSGCRVVGCVFYDIDSFIVVFNSSSSALIGCFLHVPSDYTQTYAVGALGGTGVQIDGNIIIVDDPTCDAIQARVSSSIVCNNSIWADGCIGSGINFNSSSTTSLAAYNNLIEGFSGSGGAGIEYVSNTNMLLSYNNTFYNNNTNELTSGDVHLTEGNESVGSSLFLDAGNADYSNYKTKFLPNNVGSVIGGAYPAGLNRDRGAIGRPNGWATARNISIGGQVYV